MSFANAYRAAIGAPPAPAQARQVAATPSKKDAGQPGDPSWANAAGICEATFEALRVRAMQPGPSPRVIELATPFPRDMVVSAQRLAELYTQRFQGAHRVTGLDGRPNVEGRITLLVQIEKT